MENPFIGRTRCGTRTDLTWVGAGSSPRRRSGHRGLGQFGSVWQHYPAYQQIYAATDFSGPIAITGLTFFNKQFTAGTILSATYEIQLSTTTKAVGGLSTTYASNLGADTRRSSTVRYRVRLRQVSPFPRANSTISPRMATCS